jgi:molybdenum cofactor synthesis domain-containing protein
VTTSAAVIIGNEVLSAKVVDSNTPLLITKLRRQGIDLVSVEIVKDEVATIVEAVTRAKRQATYVFTSGGIGPTHDDVTVAAVAQALNRTLVELPEMRALIIQAYRGKQPPQAAFRMALAPAGSTLLYDPHKAFPVLCCDGVFMLPGIPPYFAAQLDNVLNTLPHSMVHVAAVFVDVSEPELADAVAQVAQQFAHVEIGSYPTFDAGVDHRVKLTLEHREVAKLEESLEALIRALPEGCVVRVTKN